MKRNTLTKPEFQFQILSPNDLARIKGGGEVVHGEASVLKTRHDSVLKTRHD